MQWLGDGQYLNTKSQVYYDELEFAVSDMKAFVVKIQYLLIAVFIAWGCTPSTDRNIVSEEDAKKGEELFNKDGCMACHSTSGEIKYGPSLNNILNKPVDVIREGKTETIIVDRKYLTRSILEPDYQKVSAFKRKKMPKPEISLEDIQHLVDYIIYINSHPQNK